MELKTDNGMYLLTPEEKKTFDEMQQLAQEIKGLYFKLGRKLDRFTKLGEKSK